MNTTQYDFPVELRPVHTLNQALEPVEIKGRMAVVRTDTEKVVGIVSDQYKILRHAEVIQAFHDAIGSGAEQRKLTVVRNGAQMYANYRIKNVEGEVRKGDVVGMDLTVKNSYDGTNTLQIMLGALRLVCENGMVISKGFVGLSQKHVGANAQVKVDEIRERVAEASVQFIKQLSVMRAMAQHEIGSMAPSSIDMFEKERVKLPQYILDLAAAEYGRAGDRTMWGVYNAYTSAITHSMKRESPAAQIGYGKVAWSAVQRELQAA